MPKKILALCLFILLTIRQVSGATPVSSAQTAASTPPNVLVIYVDDLAAVLDVYGGQAITPNIDRLIAEGMTFSDAHVTAPVCNPSRISMLTGLRPSSTGITSLSPEHDDWRNYLAALNGLAYQNYGPGIDQITTLYQHFRDNGYWVTSAGKTFHSYEQLIAEPWDELAIWTFWPGIGWPVGFPMHGMTDYLEVAATRDADWGVIDNAVNAKTGVPYTEADLPDAVIGQHGLDMLAAAPTDRPFMINVGFMLPHLPWYVPQRMLDLYPLDQIQLPPTQPSDLTDIPPEGVDLVWQGGNYYDQKYIFDDEQEWRSAAAHNLASITFVDEQIGKLLDALEAEGRSENTVIVLWSDNGFHIGEKQHLQKLTLWDVSTRTPFLIKAPGVTTLGSQTDALVSAVDIFPTLVDLAGLEMPTDFARDGRSLLPLLEDPETYWPWPAMSTLGRWGWSLTDRASLRTEDWTYINYDLPNVSPEKQEELYARTDDPHEWRNLLDPANSDATAVEETRSLMELVLRGQVLPDKPPTALPADVTKHGRFAVPIRLQGEDANADFLTFQIDLLPSHGQLFQTTATGARGERITQAGTEVFTVPGWTAYVIYEPELGVRADSFSFSVSDGRNSSTAAVKLAGADGQASALIRAFLQAHGFRR